MSQVKIAVLQKPLESGQPIENEVEMLRRQKSACDEGKYWTVKKQCSGGVWGWIDR